MRPRIAAALAVASVLLLSLDAWAGSPTEQLQGFFGSAARILDNPETRERPEERLSAIRGIVSDIFDFQEAAQLSLGPNWTGRTPPEREEFVSLFANLLERSLVMGIATRIHLPGGVKVNYLDESIDGAVATVWTTIMTKSGLDLPFNYRMIERGDRWAIRDVVIDGVSLGANYQAQFLRIIRSASYAELVRQIRARVSPTSMTPLVATAAPISLGIIQGSFPAEMTRVLPTLMSPLVPTAAPISLGILQGSLPAEMTRRDSPALAQTPFDSQSHDGATGSRSATRQQPNVMRIARVQPEPAITTTEASAKEASRSAAAPRERRSPPDEPQVAMVVGRVSARSLRATSYWVQVGAFKDPEAAQRLASLLQDQGAAASDRSTVVVEPASPDRPLARVRVGPFSDRSEAVSKLREIQSRGYTPFITERP